MDVLCNGKDFFVGTKKVSFSNEINNVVEFNNYYVILLMDNEVPDNNVYAIDRNGDIVWDISQIIKLSYPEAYVSMGKINDNVLKVISYNGVEFLVDTALNVVIGKEISK